MKYYQLFKYQNNAVGGEFAFCTSEELEEINKDFKADKIEEISRDIYDMEIERSNRKFLRIATGYPK